MRALLWFPGLAGTIGRSTLRILSLEGAPEELTQIAHHFAAAAAAHTASAHLWNRCAWIGSTVGTAPLPG